MQNQSQLTIKWKLSKATSNLAFGNFWLLVDGNEIGDPFDYSVDLRGCLHWLRDFVEHPKDRYEPYLFDMDKDLAYLRLAASVLVHEDADNLMPEIYTDTFSRFHLSHIGMSSFDRATVLLIKDMTGQERLLWRTNDKPVQDAYFGADEIESIFANAITEMDAELSAPKTI